MRRFLTLVFLLGLAIPAGISVTGCYRNPAGKYCNGLGYGLLDTQVASITLQPQIAGISLAYGQTTQAQSPQASTCHGEAVSISSRAFSFGTSNNQIVDISPSGQICAGTWNRNTGGGIADFTYCNFPNPVPNTHGLPYAVAYITATADSVTSNPVPVYVHAPVTSVTLVGPQSCQSQGQVGQLDAEACYSANGKQYEICAPPSVIASGKFACADGVAPGSTLQSCNSTIGTLSFNVGNSSVASINPTNNQITAEQPGTTTITASIAGSGSSAGYFSTCPPASITVTLANGATSGSVTRGVPQNLTTTVLDTNSKPISGLSLNYQSTNPIDISVGAGGTITTNFAGVASVNAICQPVVCNPAPINQIGFNGTGLSLSSNPVNITTPGTSSNFVYFGAPGVSQYFVAPELLTGTPGPPTRLPYVPNSMVMDRLGANLYFGSAHELMIYNTSSNSLATQSTSAPGVVLAVAPDSSRVLVNDQARHLFYLFGTSGGGPITFPGMGNAAQWTPDGQTLYITDNANLNTPAKCGANQITGHTDTLYTYNLNTGWSTYPLPPSPLPDEIVKTLDSCPLPNTAPPLMAQTPAIVIPSVGAYLRGVPTVAHTWCPSGTVGNASSMVFYPQGDAEPVESDVLSATVEGHHILGAQWNTGGGITLSDIAITIPGNTVGGITTPAACPETTDPITHVQTLSPLNIAGTVHQLALANVNATSVNQVVTGSTPVAAAGGTGISLAFITYNGTTAGASLPFYLPASGGAVGTLNYVPLTGSSTITAPLAGVFSPDNTFFFVSTAGDNKIHYISIPTAIGPSSLPTDQQQISPKLPGCDPGIDAGCTFTGTPGAIVPATAIVVKPRPLT